MKLKKAIEILEDKGCVEYRPPSLDYRDAVKLGVEALKRVDFSRRDPNRPSEIPLPGETIG